METLAHQQVKTLPMKKDLWDTVESVIAETQQIDYKANPDRRRTLKDI